MVEFGIFFCVVVLGRIGCNIAEEHGPVRHVTAA
jgi:hypothetical protein